MIIILSYIVYTMSDCTEKNIITTQRSKFQRCQRNMNLRFVMNSEIIIIIRYLSTQIIIYITNAVTVNSPDLRQLY